MQPKNLFKDTRVPVKTTHYANEVKGAKWRVNELTNMQTQSKSHEYANEEVIETLRRL